MSCAPLNVAFANIQATETLSRTFCALGDRNTTNAQPSQAFTQCCNQGTSDVQVSHIPGDDCYNHCQLPDSYFAKKHHTQNVTDSFIECLNANGGYQGETLQCADLGVTHQYTAAAPAVSASWLKVGAVVALLGSAFML